MSQAALAQSAVPVERRAKRTSNRVRTRTVTRVNAKTDSTSHLYQRLWREMDRTQKAYLNIVVEQESAIHKVTGIVEAAYQRYDLATRAFNHFLKATAAQ